jgi:hypothetical protein
VTVVRDARRSLPFPARCSKGEFPKPLCLTKYRLGDGIGVPAQRVGDIVGGNSAVTAG